MSVQEFFDKFNNQPVDFDGAYGAQCVDLYDQYCQDVMGAPIILVPGAKDIWDNYPTDYFDKAVNTPEGVPQLGDVVIWGTGVGTFGHVAVFQKGDQNSFTSFDQNWPDAKGQGVAHFQQHDYNGVLGWLHPKNLAQNTQGVIDELRAARDTNWNLYQTEVKKNTDLQAEYQDEQTKNQGLREINDKLTKTDADTGTQLLSSQHDLTTALNLIQGHYKEFSVGSEQDYQKKVQALLAPHTEVVRQVQPTLDALAQAAFKQKATKSVSTISKIADKLLFWLR